MLPKKSFKRHKKANVEHIKFNNYKECLFNSTQSVEEIYRIESHKLQMYTVKEVKTSLSCFDDKKVLINKFTRLSYGHYSL